MSRPRLHDKVVLVTGATSGIGAGIVRLFAAEGARVLVHGRYAHEEAGIMGALGADGIPRERVAYRHAELTDAEQCKALIQSTDDVFGGLDVLINNAGDFRRGDIDTTTLELWDAQFGVNVRAPFILSQAAVPLMRRRGGGSIVNIGSINAYIGQPNLMAYSSAKGALTTFTKNLASQISSHNIRVNQVNPGWTLTESEDRLQRQESGRGDWLNDALTTRPFGRLLTPRDIALAVLYFASDDSALVTGSILDVEQFPVTGPLGWGKKS